MPPSSVELVRRHVVIPAAGTGKRMAAAQPKQYLTLAGKSLIEHVLDRFASSELISSITVVIASDDTHWEDMLSVFRARYPNTAMQIAPGGVERCHSVANGLTALAGHADENDWVLTHDAARPCLSADDLEKLCTSVADHAVGGILAIPVRDTLKRQAIGDATEPTVAETIPRDGLWHALTPQMFRLGVLRRALSAVINQGVVVTDEAQAVELSGASPLLIAGRPENIKVTHPEDLKMAESFLQRLNSGGYD